MASYTWTLISNTPAAASSSTTDGTAPAPPAAARDWLLDSNGDLAIVGGDWVVSGGIAAIAQAIRLELGLFAGEFFLAEEGEGVPYWESILVKNPNIPVVRDLFRNKILSVLGVVQVQSLSLTYDNKSRSASVDFAAKTDAGLLVGAVEVPAQ